MKTILHTVHIHAAPDEVYRAMTSAEGLGGWWTTTVHVDPGPGGVIRFTFQGDFHPHMKQTVLQPNRLVRWACVAGHPNWQNNTFAFALTARNGETLLQFTQEYAQELSDETYGTYNFNWGYYLNSLKQLCETGIGTPFSHLLSSPPAARLGFLAILYLGCTCKLNARGTGYGQGRLKLPARAVYEIAVGLPPEPFLLRENGRRQQREVLLELFDCRRRSQHNLDGRLGETVSVAVERRWWLPRPIRVSSQKRSPSGGRERNDRHAGSPGTWEYGSTESSMGHVAAKHQHVEASVRDTPGGQRGIVSRGPDVANDPIVSPTTQGSQSARPHQRWRRRHLLG